jgi:hypothetical protein
VFGEHDTILDLRARLVIGDRVFNTYIHDVEAHSGYEVITIGSRGEDKKTLAGWRLVTLDGFFVYKFPFGTIVKSGCQVHVVCSSKKLMHMKDDLFWKRHKGLNPNWDVVLLVDASGRVADRYQYGRFIAGR